MKTAKERTAFRALPIWQVFRAWILKDRDYTCEICGKQYTLVSHLNVHHKFETHYDNLEGHRFMVLCKTCHEYVHAKYKAPAFKDKFWFGLRDTDDYNDVAELHSRK